MKNMRLFIVSLFLGMLLISAVATDQPSKDETKGGSAAEEPKTTTSWGGEGHDGGWGGRGHGGGWGGGGHGGGWGGGGHGGGWGGGGHGGGRGGGGCRRCCRGGYCWCC